jgi:hypothetical protein
MFNSLKFLGKNVVVFILSFTLIFSLPFFGSKMNASDEDKFSYATGNLVAAGAFTLAFDDAADGDPVENTDYTYADNNLTIMTTGGLIIGMSNAALVTTTDGIQVNTDSEKSNPSNITVDAVKIRYPTDDALSHNIPFSVSGGGLLKLNLSGESIFDKNDYNSIFTTASGFTSGAALQLSDGTDIEINGSDSDSLYARTYHGAGIGAGVANGISTSAGSITINGGSISAISLARGAGIGAGWANDTIANADSINIYGGKIFARGNYGAGIGAGYIFNSGSAIAGSISIRDADVYAFSVNASGIGGGHVIISKKNTAVASVGSISMESSTVTAVVSIAAAGVGGGYASTGGSIVGAGDISIIGGNITARGGNSFGSGIGGGYAEHDPAPGFP